MFKKIVAGTLLAGLIGILVLGAINRTMGKTGKVAEAQGQGKGESNGRGGYGQGGAGNGANERQYPNYQAAPEEWVIYEGTVVSVDADALVVETAAGEEIIVEGRPWQFAQEQGFSVQASDQMTLTGFYEGSDPSTANVRSRSGRRFEVGKIENITNGQTVLIRDEDGQPLWAGRGRRGM